MNTRLLIIHALSPVHCGTGQAVGGIDLPIAREKPTGIPLIPGSSIKGVLRAMGKTEDPLHRVAFGPPTEQASEHAGSLQFSDANLVFLPTRSVRGTFAWTTSPYILRRLARDAREAGLDAKVPTVEPDVQTAIIAGTTLQAGTKVVFEDIDLTAKVDAALLTFTEHFAKWLFGAEEKTALERAHFAARVCVVHDDVMSLLLQTNMEITARIRLDADTKTVMTGALWTEEALPIESVLAGLAVATPIKQKGKEASDPATLLAYVQGLATGSALQLGGKASVGRGVCRIRMEG